MLVVTHLVGFGSRSAGPQIEIFSTMAQSHTGYSSNVQYHAMRFVPTWGGTVVAAELGGCQFGGLTWACQVYNEGGGGNPGSGIGTAHSGVAAVTHPSTFSFTPSATVAANTAYWIVFNRVSSTDGISVCAPVTGYISGSAATAGGIASEVGMAGAELRASVTINP